MHTCKFSVDSKIANKTQTEKYVVNTAMCHNVKQIFSCNWNFKISNIKCASTMSLRMVLFGWDEGQFKDKVGLNTFSTNKEM